MNDYYCQLTSCSTFFNFTSTARGVCQLSPLELRRYYSQTSQTTKLTNTFIVRPFCIVFNWKLQKSLVLTITTDNGKRVISRGLFVNLVPTKLQVKGGGNGQFSISSEISVIQKLKIGE